MDEDYTDTSYSDQQTSGKNWRYLNETLLYQYEALIESYKDYLRCYLRQKWHEKAAIVLYENILTMQSSVKGLGFDAYVQNQDYPDTKPQFKEITVEDYYTINAEVVPPHKKLMLMHDVLTYWLQSDGPFNTMSLRPDPYNYL